MTSTRVQTPRLDLADLILAWEAFESYHGEVGNNLSGS